MTKKTRFEVFKRDGFKCAYCGQAPPAVVLEVDHIQPKSKGGKDDINNYITSCFPCNRGKSNNLLDKIPEKLEDNLALMREKEDQIKEYNKFLKKIERRLSNNIDEINLIYNEAYPGWIFSDRFKRGTLKTFLGLLPKQEIKDSLYIAIDRFPEDKDNVIKYFCGICWNKIKGTERH